jgi:hypothetical protein
MGNINKSNFKGIEDDNQDKTSKDNNKPGVPLNYSDRFYKTVFSTMNLEDLKIIYDHVELYDPTKTYEEGIFEASYSGSVRKYKWIEYRSNGSSYVVSERYYSPEQIKELEPYCRCYVCRSSWFNLKAWCTCRCCIGCVKSGYMAQIYQIEKAIEYRDEINNKH